MHAFIICGGSDGARKEYLEKRILSLRVSPFDVIRVTNDTPAIGIDEIRDFQHRLTLKPRDSQYSLGIIADAQKLTPQAQNALLKTLEEPPLHALVFLITPNTSILLPTILSRCQVIDLGAISMYTKEELERCVEIIQKLRRLPFGKRLQGIDTIVKNREDATLFLDQTLFALHQLLASDIIVSRELTPLIRTIVSARNQLSGNVNFKLVIDSVFLSLPWTEAV